MDRKEIEITGLQRIMIGIAVVLILAIILFYLSGSSDTHSLLDPNVNGESIY